MVEFVRDVMIAVAVLATVIAFAVRSNPEHAPTPRTDQAERLDATAAVAQTTLIPGIQRANCDGCKRAAHRLASTDVPPTR